MPVEIRVPATLGESVIEATVGKWLKQVGDPVAEGETVVELETDKVNLEVPADSAGVLEQITRETGAVVGVGEVLGILGANSAATVMTPASAPAEPVQPPAPTTEGPPVDGTPQAISEAEAPARVPVTPLARKLAIEGKVDLAHVRGSGLGGRITKDDVVAQREQIVPPPVSAPAPPPAQSLPHALPPAQPYPAGGESPLITEGVRGREQRVRMSRRRQTIARRLVEAQHTAAMLTTFNEVDMSAIMDVRKRRRDDFKERHGVSLGFMSFFTKAAIGALKAFPRLNAEIQGDEMLLKSYYDIGIAVSADEGLVVPVVREADRKSFAQIEREIADLAARARNNSLTLAELQGGTFTITNGGVFGSLLSTPILNTPQVGILGMHKIQERPMAVGGQVAIRPMMYLALSYDHRIVDGSEAVRFLVRIKELLEDPESLLLEG